jgi:hypothetical protein
MLGRRIGGRVENLDLRNMAMTSSYGDDCTGGLVDKSHSLRPVTALVHIGSRVLDDDPKHPED